MFNQQNLIGCMSADNISYLKRCYNLKSNVKVKQLRLWGPQVVDTDTTEDTLANLWGFQDDEVICLFGGQLIPGRGVENILRLAEIFLSEHPEIIFVIVGEGPLKSFAKDLKLKKNLKNLKLLDRMPRSDYLKLLRAVDIGLVFTAGNEGMPVFPSKSIDYMRAGLPIVAAVEKTSDFGRVLESEFGAGLAADEADFEAIKKVIRILATDEKLRVQLGQNGADFYRHNLLSSVIVDELLKQVFGDETR